MGQPFASERAGALAIVLAAISPVAMAQTAPDAGSLLRDTEKSLPTTPAPRPLPGLGQPQAPTSQPGGAQVHVKAFDIRGAKTVPQEALRQAVAPWVGRTLGFAELRKAADAVSAVYRDKGLLVRTYLPEQDLDSGVVVIVVVEGRLSGLRIERIDGAQRLDEGVARRRMLARQHEGDIVRTEDLERAIGLMNELPGISASSVLEPGAREGESVVAVALRDKSILSGVVQLDNTGAKSTGETRVTAGLSVNSPLRIGDQIQILGNKSRDALFARLAYELPIGVDGWRAGVAVSRLDYDYDLSGSNYKGDAGVVGVQASYPLLRRATSNLSLAMSWDRKDFRNLVQGAELSNKKLTVANIGVTGDVSDNWLGGGVNQYALSYSGGRLDLSANAADLASDQMAQGPDRQGGFGKVTWLLTRVQRVTDADSLSLTASGQFARDNLDSSEKFLATGPSGVRAYSTTEPSGDDAALLNLEWLHKFGERLGLSFFYDTAHIRRDRRTNAGSLTPNSFDLSGAGLGVNYGKSGDFSVKATVAWRIGRNPARILATGMDSDGTHRDPRVAVTVIKAF